LVYIGYGPAPAYKCVFQIPSYLALFPHKIRGIAVLVGFVEGDLCGDLVKLVFGLADGLLDVYAETDIVYVVASEILGVILAVPVPVGVRVLDGVSVPVGESVPVEESLGGGSGDD
jgi:hypothetical protein